MPTEAQNLPPAEAPRYEAAYQFFSRFMEEKIFRPETVDDLRTAYHSIQLLGRIRTNGARSSDLEEINQLALSPNLPTIAYLAGTHALHYFRERFSSDFGSEIDTVLNNFASLASSLIHTDQDTFGARPYGQTEGVLLLGAVTNEAQLEINETAESNVVNATDLRAATQVVKDKYLQLYLPRITTISIENEEDYPSNALYPDTRMICPRHKLASWDKMEEGAVVGVPINRRERVFERRLPAALVCLESEYNLHRMRNGRNKSNSKLDFLRLPAIEKPTHSSLNPQSMFEHYEHTDENIVSADMINSLTYWASIRSLRDYLSSTEGAQTEITVESLDRAVESFLNRVTSPIVDESNDQTITYPSVLERAVQEYNQKHPTDLWNTATAREYMKDAMKCIMSRPEGDTRTGLLLRSEDEIEQMAIDQTVKYLPGSTLLACARIFINHPVNYFMTDEQIHDYELLLPQVIDLIDRSRQIGQIEDPSHIQLLQQFIKKILQVRYETIRDTSILSNKPDNNEKEE